MNVRDIYMQNVNIRDFYLLHVNVRDIYMQNLNIFDTYMQNVNVRDFLGIKGQAQPLVEGLGRSHAHEGARALRRLLLFILGLLYSLPVNLLC